MIFELDEPINLPQTKKPRNETKNRTSEQDGITLNRARKGKTGKRKKEKKRKREKGKGKRNDTTVFPDPHDPCVVRFMHLLMPPTSSPDGVIDNSQVRRDRIGDRDYPRLHFASWDELGGKAEARTADTISRHREIVGGDGTKWTGHTKNETQG